MKSLFILQLVCCVITAMLALQLAMASLQVRWKVWRYEISRWILVASMLFFSVHYLLQMIHGLRAQGTDVGAAFNILFYTPVAFAIIPRKQYRRTLLPVLSMLIMERVMANATGV